jgi:WD40 repeat protein
VTSVKYSSVKPSRLGTSCVSVVISFWDCNSKKNIFNVTPHCAPVTAITFSPINDTLALSVGLYKRLVCCDTKTKKVTMSIQCENPLTAADFNMDGVSSRKKVLVYDLRSPKTPTKTLTVNNTSVTSMVFKHRVDRQQVAQVMRPKLSQHMSTPSLRTVQEETKDRGSLPVRVS